MGPFGIEQSAYHQPATKRTVFDWADLHGYSPEFVERANEHFHIDCYYVSDVTAEELVLDAVAKLQLTREQVDRLEFVIYFHTLQPSIRIDGGSTPLNVARSIGAQNAKCFSVAQQNCVSPMVIFRILQALHDEGKFRKSALVIGADVVLDEGMRLIDGMQMESDGAVAMMITVGHERGRILDVQVITHGEHYAGMDVSSSGEAMNPTADRLGYLMLSRLGRRIQRRTGHHAFDFIVPHNVNPPGLIKVATALGTDESRIFLRNIARNGHHYGCDNIINYLDARTAGLIRDGDLVLWMAVGMGRTYGACLVAA